MELLTQERDIAEGLVIFKNKIACMEASFQDGQQSGRQAGVKA